MTVLRWLRMKLRYMAIIRMVLFLVKLLKVPPYSPHAVCLEQLIGCYALN